MDLPALRAYVNIVQAGSFTRAADLLGTDKARLSRQLGALEAGLGVRLLTRSTRSLSLTEAGREFFERAVGILAAVDEAERAMQQTQSEPRGRLKLTCGVEFGQIAVNDWIQRYLARHPQVGIEADYTGRLVDLVHEGYDLAIRVGPLADSSLSARRLGVLRYGLYAAPGHLARRGLPESPEALATRETLVFAGGSHQSAWTLSGEGRTVRVELEPRLKANHSFAVRDAAIAGLGIALLPRLVAEPALAAGTLLPVLPDWQGPSVPVHAVYASARYLTPKVRAFIDLAVESFGGG